MYSKTGRTVVAVIIILAGVILFNYPNIATFFNNITANRQVSEYQEAVEAMDDETKKEYFRLANLYNAALPTAFPADPFTMQNIRDFTGTEFEDFYMVQPGATIGVLEVPQINIKQPIYFGTSEEVLNKGLGLLENTSLPVGGNNSHAVISGHTGMATRKLFTDLDQMKEGDIFFLHVMGEDFAYKVDQIKVVLPEHTEDLMIQQNHDYVTLLTCTPFGINSHRLLVRGTRTPYDFLEDDDTPTTLKYWQRHIKEWIAGFGGMFLFLLLVFLKIRHDRKRDRQRAAAKAAAAGEAVAETIKNKGKKGQKKKKSKK